jgi:hypothetical protein
LNYLYFTKVDPSSEYTLEIILPMDAGNCDLGAYREWFTKLKDTQQLSGEEQQAEKERITQMIQDQVPKHEKGGELTPQLLEQFTWVAWEARGKFDPKDPFGYEASSSPFEMQEAWANLYNKDGNVIQMNGTIHDNHFTVMRFNYFNDPLEMKTWMAGHLSNKMDSWTGPDILSLNR